MSFYRTDDPVADFERYDAEQQRKQKNLPKCSDCGEPIQDEFFYEFDCYFYCHECVNEKHRKSTEDLIE